MSYSSARPGLAAAWRRAGPALAPRNWRVASRLVVLVAIPALLGVALAGLRVTGATASARAYGQVGRLAVLGQQAVGLAQEMEHERGETAALVAGGQPAAGLAALHRQYAITDGRAATVRRLVRQLGGGFPAQTRAGANSAVTSIAELPGLRRDAAQSGASALSVINGYSAAIAGLFPVIDGIADPSGNSVLITSVRALGALSRMEDLAAQQQAVLGASLAEGRLAPGALTALTVAAAQEASDLASFRSSATPAESRALSATMAGPQATRARAVQQRAMAAGPGPLALGARAAPQWQAGMSFTVSWMGRADQQLAGWITADAGSLRQSEMRSAVITGAAALAVLAIAVAATMIMTRSVVRPLRRLEAAALDMAEVRLPAEVRALAAGGTSGPPVPVTSLDIAAPDEIGQVARAVDQVRGQALRLAADQARQRGSISAIFASSVQRSYALLEQQLRLIDSMELGEDDPGRLASLFELDHLATRMLRNADRALVLGGHETPRPLTEPVALVDVLRAASSEIEHYDRVSLNVQLEVWVAGSAAADTVHLLAELLENGTAFSSEETGVIVSVATPRSGDLVISMTDAGPGLSDGQLQWLNWQLAHPPVADETLARQLGVFAVAHLAKRHGISVALRLSPGGGVTAEVRLPAALISHDAPGETAAALGASAAGEAGAGAGAGPAGAAAGAGPAGAAAGAGEAGPAVAGKPDPAVAVEAGAAAVVRPLDVPVSPPAPAASGAAARTEPDAGQQPPAAEPDAGQPPPAAAADAAASGRTSAGLPKRVQRAPGSAAGRPAPHLPAADSAQIARGRLASFQRGSRRARADRDAAQPAQDR